MKKSERSIAEGFLFTDQYQLTMAQLYFRLGLHETPVQFDYFFRDYPNYGTHKAGFCIFAGLEWLIDWMKEATCTPEDAEALRRQTGRGGGRLFHEDFLRWLSVHGNFESLTLRAVAEGRVVHPHVPLVVAEGPLASAQMLETSLLNHLNHQTLIATKAARLQAVGRGAMFLEFGMRRGQDRGVIAGTRAALIGGADYSSNVGTSQLLGVPPKGTHAHSMVQAFLTLGMTEFDAFQAFADTYPDDCVLLVDTVNTLESGVPNAIRVFEQLRRRGHSPAGVRLDSGDLAYLSVQVARMLDAAGFPDTTIVLSNDLDELTIMQIIAQISVEAPQHGVDPDRLVRRLAYGVGTRLVTSHGDPSLGGVYKLVSVKREGEWIPAIKISESPWKIPTPGNKQVWRLYDWRGKAVVDLIGLRDEEPMTDGEFLVHHVFNADRFRTLPQGEIQSAEPLLQELLSEGVVMREFPTLEEMREARKRDMDRLDPGVKRLINPHIYHVSLTERLWSLKMDQIKNIREQAEPSEDRNVS